MKQFLFIISFLCSFAMSHPQKGSYTVYLNNSEGSIKADVVYENKSIRVDENLSYFWYSSNKIMETKGGYDGRMLDGNYTSYYLNDNLHEKGQFSNGLKNGQWTLWYENGKIKEISHWKHGLKDGLFKKFDVRGNLQQVANMKHGKLHGAVLQYNADTIQRKQKYVHGVEKLPKVPKVKTAKDSASKHKWFFQHSKEPKPGLPTDTSSKEKSPSSTTDTTPKQNFWHPTFDHLFPKKKSKQAAQSHEKKN